MRFRAILGRELAWDSMATADWVRICCRTNSVISLATSTSEICDSAACKFSAWIPGWRWCFPGGFAGAEVGADLVLGDDGFGDLVKASWASSWVEMLRPALLDELAAPRPRPKAEAVEQPISM